MSIETPFDPDQRRMDALTEGSGRSTYDAREQVTGTGDIPGTTETPRMPRSPRTVRPSGHVRGFDDGELRDSELFKSDEPLTDEQREINKKGIQQLRRKMGDASIQVIVRQVEEMIPIDPDNVQKSLEDRERQVNARLRTHFENLSKT